MKEKLEYELHHCKVFAQAFFKKLAVSKGRALVARRNERNSLNGAFLFAKLFLLRLVCQKKKRYRRRILLVGVCAKLKVTMQSENRNQAFPCQGRGTACGG